MANKKGPIGKVEAFYIDNHYRTKSVEDIATDLGRSITSVEKYITKNHVRQKPTVTVGDQFSRREGVTIMTENASTMSDSRKSKKPINKSCVTKIRYDK